MKKSRKISLAILAIALPVGTAIFALRPREPAYQGRTLRSWLKEFDDGYESADTNAIAAIQAIGTNGLPVLLAELEYEEPLWREKYREIADKLPIVKPRLQPPWNRDLWAAYAFHALGAEGKPAISALSGLLFQGRSAIPAAFALAGIGQDALPELANALSHTNARIRMAVVEGLGGWRGNARTVVPLLIKTLADESQLVRREAAQALGELERFNKSYSHKRQTNRGHPGA